LGIRRGICPTRVSHTRSRYPFRYVLRSGVRSHRPAPTCSDTSSSISASANSRTPSRNTSKALSPWYWRNSSNSAILNSGAAGGIHIPPFELVFA
jgi:hypothetical protein